MSTVPRSKNRLFLCRRILLTIDNISAAVEVWREDWEGVLLVDYLSTKGIDLLGLKQNNPIALPVSPARPNSTAYIDPSDLHITEQLDWGQRFLKPSSMMSVSTTPLI